MAIISRPNSWFGNQVLGQSGLGLGAASNATISSMQALNAQREPPLTEQLLNIRLRDMWTSGVDAMGVRGSVLGQTHFGQVRTMREIFRELSKEEFREMGKEPVVKEILAGAVKLSKEEIISRIKEHIDRI